MLGDIGSQFSIGQMQRLYLARAFYRQPAFMFLDEGTANLDAESAEVIKSLISKLQCTRLIVTHDIGFAACASRVLALHQGWLTQVHLDQQMKSPASLEVDDFS